LVALINGSAFTDPDTLRQHLRLAQLRAVENRRTLVRCAATGVTCVIHPDGRIAAQLPIEGDGVLQTSIPLVDDLTIYTKFGDWFAELSVIVAAAMLVPFRRFTQHDRAI
jgi:apolipoprotein N-acyltransferase